MSDSPDRYTISMSKLQSDQVKKWATLARELGFKDAFLHSLKEIQFRLEVEPDEWGESRQFLPELQIEMRLGVTEVLVVHYGVQAESRTVFVKQFRLNHRFRPGSWFPQSRFAVFW